MIGTEWEVKYHRMMIRDVLSQISFEEGVTNGGRLKNIAPHQVYVKCHDEKDIRLILEKDISYLLHRHRYGFYWTLRDLGVGFSFAKKESVGDLLMTLRVSGRNITPTIRDL